MRYAEYVTWFKQERSNLTLEPGCIEVGPNYNATPTDRPPWGMIWCVRFADQKHLRIKEQWWPRPLRMGGRGYRKHFAFHYGESNPVLDPFGVPVKDEILYPTIIRIDVDPYGPHMHFHGEDHIFQNRVQGFTISDAEPFKFVEAVLRYRSKGNDFDKVLGFKVTK